MNELVKAITEKESQGLNLLNRKYSRYQNSRESVGHSFSSACNSFTKHLPKLRGRKKNFPAVNSPTNSPNEDRKGSETSRETPEAAGSQSAELQQLAHFNCSNSSCTSSPSQTDQKTTSVPKHNETKTKTIKKDFSSAKSLPVKEDEFSSSSEASQNSLLENQQKAAASGISSPASRISKRKKPKHSKRHRKGKLHSKEKVDEKLEKSAPVKSSAVPVRIQKEQEPPPSENPFRKPPETEPDTSRLSIVAATINAAKEAASLVAASIDSATHSPAPAGRNGSNRAGPEKQDSL